ncbi:solute carrier family 35 member F6-like [Babylonia areolata]|uniref:solute carrier family 35 member F6-like n=1 Tax=Babylonia areolata TaxID=304850 RepID=UPI003FCF81D9
MPRIPVEDIILSFIYVGSSTVYTITPQIAKHHNATGVSHWREHPFEHPFLLMAFEFLAQALCLLLWYIITGGVTPRRNPHIYGPNRIEARDQAYAQPQPVDGEDDQPLLAEGEENIQDGNDVRMLNPGADEQENAGQDEQPIYGNPAWNQAPVDQTKFNMFLFLVPAFFDLSRYGLLYVAINLTFTSSYILSRCAAVLFTVLLRVAFLSKHMAKYMWVSIGMVIVGLGLFGMTDFVHKMSSRYDKYGLAAGCLLMVMAQIMIAMQIVYEEKFMDKHSIHPLRVIGLEGCFGSVVAVILLLPFSFIKAGPFSGLYQSHLVDIKDAFLQMKSSYVLALCFLGRIVSKTVSYYTGLRFVANQRDAAKRITIDVHHDLIIWFFALVLHWKDYTYFYPQIIGFIFVPIGMLVYCDVIPLPAVCRPHPIPPPNQCALDPDLLQLDEQDAEARNREMEERGEGEANGGGHDAIAQ